MGEIGVNHTMNILTVIVTYNRKDLLKRCLEALSSQTRSPENILVINNSSTDGTDLMLTDMGIDFITQPNLGSAGGWHAGIKYAIENNFDACWLMDDDGYPDDMALEVLSSNINQKVACVSSVVLKESDKNTFVFPFPVLNRRHFPRIFHFRRRYFNIQEISKKLIKNSYPFAHLFNGALLNMSLVKKVGNINVDYFIMGDEVDFFYRLRQEGKILTHFHAKHFHPDVSSRPYSKVKIYFLIKNTIIINYLYLDNKLLRSILNIPVVLYRTFKRNGFLYLISLLIGDRKKYLFNAIKSGFVGKIGNDLDG